LLGALLLASVIAFLLTLRFRAANTKPLLDNLTGRVQTWWVMVIVMSGTILALRHVVLHCTLTTYLKRIQTRQNANSQWKVIIFNILAVRVGFEPTSAP
jgi:predicted CDP-diglyceride synthetase/phosphatidate cytidylyltransferase